MPSKKGTVEERDANKPSDAERTERAIKVLRDFATASEAQSPAITPASTGVMINYARQLVRKAS